MVRYLTFWLRYLASLLLVPRVVAWTLVWRNGTTPSSVEDGQSAQNCTQIWHEENREFSWDPEGPWCLKFYSDPICEFSNGITCEGYLWKKQATQNISAFSVYPMPPSSVTAFGFASSSTAIPTTTTTTTPMPTDANAEETPVVEAVSHGNGKLSAGAIAGIAVGASIAVALLCAAFFYLGRRSRRKAAAAAAAAAATSLPRSDSPSTAPLNTSSSTNPSSPPSDDLSSSPTLAAAGTMIAELPKPPMVEIQHVPPPDYIQPPNGTRMIELPGQTPEVELSNTHQVQEMSVSRQIQELEGHSIEKRGV
ncbi:hypothetical protein BDW72DRAFT_166706 [Aspergillus terricola var. indicus]